MAKNRDHEKTVESDSDSTDNDSQESESESESEQTKTTPAAAATKKPILHKKSASKTLFPPTMTRRSPSPNNEKTGTTKKPMESDSDSSDNDSQESEPEQTITTPAAATKKPTLHKKSASKPQTSSESDGSSGSDSDEPESPKSHPPQKTTGARKSISAAADLVTPAAPKRPAEEEKESKVSKKKKAAEPESCENPKKSIFQRKWSEGDEIVILQGMVDYWDQKEADPNADVNAFLDFIKENLNRKDSLKSHLQDKIRKLRIKYENNLIREEKTGKEMTFSKPHDQAVFELSKSVWGRIKKKKRTVVEGKANSEGVDALFLARRVKSNFGASFEESLLSLGAEIFESGKGDAAAAAGAKGEWEKLRKEEVQANLRLFEVKAAQARLVIEHLK